ncbi:RNA-DNA hybrid ribonuclease [Phytophthora pseudosyringae]|uniref:ribonuclease H n=1 Tax=Phytophthora pseudosyringae TaxID=221518 RepID=A0A8T1W1N7_9STRA|nr:RNA-DNA hybrid ribonuclease [Phytophthora pseudosyringae]
MAKGCFYAVAAGRSTGVFTTWGECEAHVKGFNGCRYKKFKTRSEAQTFIDDYNGQRGNSEQKPAANPNKVKRPREESTVLEDELKPPSAQKLKQYVKDTFYAVAKGLKTGIVTTQDEVDKMTVGYPGHAAYKKFASKQAARDYLAAFDNATKSTSMMKNETSPSAAASKSFAGAEKVSKPSGGWWYAVAKGRKTGVFRSWNEAKKQVENLFSPSFKKFPTKEEAEAFVNQHAVATGKQDGDSDPKDPNTLVAFCDGSALENGRRRCRAGYACIFPHNEDWNVAKQLAEERATNNRAEYMAALEGMKRANVEDPDASRMLYIFSDSMLLIRSMTEWVGTWQKNNWIKSDGAPVQNRDLLELLMAEKGDRRIRWTHVKAHTGKTDWRSKWNDVADNAARNAALSVGED